MRLPDLLRYGTWGGVVVVAEANRRHYRMATTWLPHLTTNTLALLLPDLHRLLWPQPSTTMPEHQPGAAGLLRLAEATLSTLVRNNPHYVAYVLPLAAGYLLSSPFFNIYKGALGELRLAGFGLDALPHAATGFALATLVADGVQTAARLDEQQALVQWCARNEVAVSALALVLATAFWELGEYRIHRHELSLRGSTEAINMQWSLEDTLYDCLSNTLGWAAAMLWRQTRPQ